MEQQKSLGPLLLQAYADYLSTTKHPIGNIEIIAGVNHATFMKTYRVCETRIEPDNALGPVVRMNKKFEFKIYNGYAVCNLWRWLEVEGLTEYDSDYGNPFAGWNCVVSDAKLIQEAILKMMPVFKKNDAEQSLIDKVIAKMNQRSADRAARQRSATFKAAADAWNAPLPESAKGTFDQAFQRLTK